MLIDDYEFVRNIMWEYRKYWFPMEFVIKTYVKFMVICMVETYIYVTNIYVDGGGRNCKCDGLMVCAIIFKSFNQFI